MSLVTMRGGLPELAAGVPCSLRMNQLEFWLCAFKEGQSGGISGTRVPGVWEGPTRSAFQAH